MNNEELLHLIAGLANEFDVPGVAAGLWYQGRAIFACHGVTSIENPLPIDEHTLFQAGSIGKNYTATALMLLAANGAVELDSPLFCYLPELQLRDPNVSKQVTLRQLLNHTAGWEGDFFPDTGDGDDALARFVLRMDELQQLTPPGAAFSYNNAAFCLAGRVIEKVTGKTYEEAIRQLLFEPLGLRESFFFRDQVMTRRFVVGHKPTQQGGLQVARPWALPRNGAPAGGVVTSINDLLCWARFHLGDYPLKHELQQLSHSQLPLMREPGVHMPGCGFGDAFGLGWFLSKAGDFWLVSHGGSTNGQEANLSLLPEHNWALAILTNSSPGGMALNEALRKRVLAFCTGLEEAKAVPAEASAKQLVDFEGEYRARGMHCQISGDNQGNLLLTIYDDPELLSLMYEDAPRLTSAPSVLTAKLVKNHRDRYVFTDGLLQGITGYFERGHHDKVQAVHLFGRRLPRTFGNLARQ